MSYRVNWTLEAGRNLVDLRSYIETENPSAARRISTIIKASAQSLEALPHRGKPGRKRGTRELILPDLPWIIGYSVDDRSRTVTILHIHHYAQLRS